MSHSNPNLILTGSYDATVRLFDARTGACEMVMGGPSASNSASPVPVEQVLMFPSGTVALSSAGPILRAWDLIAGGRCLRALSNHQKTITSLAFDSQAGRLLTGGLDHMVKVYDVSSYKVVHTMRYPAPILCLAVSVRFFYSNLVKVFGNLTKGLCSPTTHILPPGCPTEHFPYDAANPKLLKLLPSHSPSTAFDRGCSTTSSVPTLRP